MLSDEELMLVVGRGDLDAFEQIVLRYQGEVWNTAYRFLDDRTEANDIAQEVFVRVFEASSRYEPTASFRTYLYCILNRLCLDHVRKARPTPIAELPQAADPTPPPDEASLRKERDAAVRRAVNTLPPEQRMAVVLRYFERLTWTEIAETMDVSPKAVERLLSRGRKALGKHLAAFLGE